MKRILSQRQINEEFDFFGTDLNVVQIDPENPENRGRWYSGLNINAAFREVIENQQRGFQSLVFRTADLRPVAENETTWTLTRYQDAAAKLTFPKKYGARR